MKEGDVIKMIWESHKEWHDIKGSRLKMTLFNKNKVCCYCGCETILNEEQTSRDLRAKERLDPKTATIEHLYDRFDIRRYDVKIPKMERFAIACDGCNQAQQRKQYARLNRKEVKYLSIIGRQRPRGVPRALMYVDIIIRLSSKSL